MARHDDPRRAKNPINLNGVRRSRSQRADIQAPSPTIHGRLTLLPLPSTMHPAKPSNRSATRGRLFPRVRSCKASRSRPLRRPFTSPPPSIGGMLAEMLLCSSQGGALQPRHDTRRTEEQLRPTLDLQRSAQTPSPELRRLRVIYLAITPRRRGGTHGQQQPTAKTRPRRTPWDLIKTRRTHTHASGKSVPAADRPGLVERLDVQASHRTPPDMTSSSAEQ
jgi:hypothetical protein